MINLFTTQSTTAWPIITAPQFKYVKAGLLNNLERVTHYYRTSAGVVHNSHVLVKILLTLNLTRRQGYQEMVDYIADTAPDFYRSLGLVAPTCTGAVHRRGSIYNHHAPEVYIAANEDFNVDLAVSNWRTLQPVRVLRHPYSDLSLVVGDAPRSTRSDSGSLSVFSINIPMLALQYRMWIEESDQFDPDRPQQALHKFLIQYPLTNMLRSHLDIALFNRLSAIQEGEELTPYVPVVGVWTNDYTHRLDEVIDIWLDHLTNSHDRFAQMLMTIQGITQDTMLQALVVPDIPLTRQVEWALLVGRLRTVLFLLRMNRVSGAQNNIADVRSIAIGMQELFNDRALLNLMDEETRAEVDTIRRLL